jgi:putative proteasome-type protease
MTFCLSMHVEEGLVGIADTRITTGSECITARKLTHYTGKRYAFYVMTSGLRSIRDKAITYFEEEYQNIDKPWDRLFKVANAYAAQMRRAAEEDRHFLEASGFRFNAHALIGGQMEKDAEHKLYLVYPEGNWVEIGAGTPYAIIGNSGYGKPVLDRALHHSDTMRYAFKVGCLSFDSTRISAADVDLPIDVVLLPRGTFHLTCRRIERADFADIMGYWDNRLRNAIKDLPFERLESFFEDLPAPSDRIVPMKRGAPDG